VTLIRQSLPRPKQLLERLKRPLSIVGAVILAVSGIVKLMKENAAERHSAPVSANERYTNYLTQSTISMQILLKQINETNANLRAINKMPAPKRNFSEVVAGYVQSSEQLWADLNRNADEVAKLANALPSDHSGLREEIGKATASVESRRSDLKILLADKSDTKKHFELAKTTSEQILLSDITAIELGDKVMSAIDEVSEHQESRLKLLGTAINILVPLLTLA
jgi:hypothetical protein